MAVTYLINGSSPESLGVQILQREEVNFGVCRVSLEVVYENGLHDPPFDYDDAVTITRDDGGGAEGWFVGYAMPPRHEPGTGKVTQEIVSFWKKLERLMYLQLWYGYVSSRCLLFGTPADDDYAAEYAESPNITASTAKQIEYLCNYAIGKGVKFQLGTMFQGVKTGPREVKGRMIGDLIREIALQHPLAMTWVDWTTKVGSDYVPTLNFVQAGDGESGTAPASITVALKGSLNPEALQITPRSDLVVPAVIVRLEEQENDGTVTVVQTQKYPTDATGDEDGAINLSMTLDQRFTWDLTSEGRAINTVDAPQLGEDRNLPRWIFDQFGYLHYDGTLTLTEAVLGADRFTGKVLNISNGRTEWATMNALVQRVVTDPHLGQRSISFGMDRNRTLPNFRSLVQDACRTPGGLIAQQMRDAPGNVGPISTEPFWFRVDGNLARINGGEVLGVVVPTQNLTVSLVGTVVLYFKIEVSYTTSPGGYSVLNTVDAVTLHSGGSKPSDDLAAGKFYLSFGQIVDGVKSSNHTGDVRGSILAVDLSGGCRFFPN